MADTLHHRAVALTVVADAFLLQRIVSYQRGLPRDLVELACSVRDTYSLVEYAITGPNLRLLKRLFRYYTEQPEYCRSQPTMSFHGVWLYAVRKNRLEIAQWVDKQPSLTCSATPTEIWSAVINSENVEMLAYVTAKYPDLFQKLSEPHIENIAKRGLLDFLLWLGENASVRIPYSVPAVTHAAKEGHLAVVQYLHVTFSRLWSMDPMDAAAGRGHLDLVAFLHTTRTEGCTTKAMDSAAALGHLDVVRFLHEKRTEGCTIDAMNQAAANGHLDVVRFLHENRSEGCTEEAVNVAAANGHLEVVRFLLSYRLEGCTEKAMDQAASHGHLDVLRYLMTDHSRACTATAFEAAVKKEWMDVAYELLDRDPLLCTSEALCIVAERGDFEATTKFLPLVARVAPWTATWAARNGHTAIVKYILDHCPSCRHEHVIVGAATCGHVETVQYLHENYHRYCTSSTLLEAAKNGHLNVLKYLFANCGVSASKLLLRAVYSGKLDVVRYVMQMYPDANLADAHEYAVRREYPDIAWFLANTMERTGSQP